MSVRETRTKPEAMAHFPDDRYRWLTLHDGGDVYAYAAIRERGPDLELHISFIRWGPQVRRRVREDVAWLKDEARRLGKKRIMGVRADGQGRFDPGLFRFARMFGFTAVCVLQTASLDVGQ